MKKLLIVLLIVVFAWMVKLSYDLFKLRAAHVELRSSLSSIQQHNATLNDHVVALQRKLVQQQAQPSANNSVPQPSVLPASNDAELVRQQLNLIEFALQQQQYSLALEKLSQLQLNVENYALAPALIESLKSGLSKDQVMLQQFVQGRLIQQQRIRELLDQVDEDIAQELKAPHQSAVVESTSFWQRLIQIEPVKQPSQVLMQRGIILKEAQLRLLLAQQVLQQGQQLAFQQALSSVIEVLQPLPDRKSQQWIKQLEQMKTTPLAPIPPLNTRILMS